MKLIWGYQGVRVWVTGVCLQTDPAMEGLAVKGNGSIYSWLAVPNANGWYVTVRQEITGWEESFQGATYNLGLEVGTAVGRTR